MTAIDRVDWSDPLSYVREMYGVPANVGQRVRFLGRHDGEVVGADRQYVRIRLDEGGEVLTVHPTWQMEYVS